MKCSELATLWPERWPRPDPDNTVNTACQVRPFCRDFADRAPSSIDDSEAQAWAMLNPGTARYVRTMFNDLLDAKLIDVNPFALVRIPVSGSSPIVVPTAAQVDALVEGARAIRDGYRKLGLASRIRFAAETGLRYAEQKAVLVPGPGTEGNTFSSTFDRLNVDYQLNRKRQLKRPKTKRGTRVVMVNQAAQGAILSRPQGFMWPLSRKTDNEEWAQLRRDVGVWIRWHDLRHYHATQLLDAGAKVDDVALQLGCRAEEIRDTYGHPDAELALQRLEGLGNA